LDPPVGRRSGSRGHAALHRDGAADRVEGAGELDQQAIACGLDDAAAMRADFGFDQLLSQGAQPCQGAFLVIADEPAVAGDIGGQDGGDAPRRGGLALGHPAPQYALHPRQQFARLERLGDVIVSAGLEPDHAVHRVGGRGHHDDADAAALLAQPARQGEPVLARQVDVEQYQCRRPLLDEAAQCRTAVDGADPKILPGEIVGEQLPLRRFVIDHDNMGPRVHGLPIGVKAKNRRLG
jgi:hypothetical protein